MANYEHSHNQLHSSAVQSAQELAQLQATQLQAMQNSTSLSHVHFHQQSEDSQLISLPKRLDDDVLSQPSVGFSGLPESSSPDRKRRKMNGEQQQKRVKYDVLKSFFRVYFKVEKENMVLKDSVYNLYIKKIPADMQIARNAMYRHMWAFFRDKITNFQSNYREYVKGVKMIDSQSHLTFDSIEKDIAFLREAGVTGELFDFSADELCVKDKMTSFALSSTYINSNDGDASILAQLDNIEQTTKSLLASIKDVKARLKKKTT
mmetsp:Transcript_52329/g.131435  ORF Transcript_52329/g.131435 Transcript_52329/m.131435 type:complete len:262 (-) Transcript_52329:81-866(-)